MDNVMAGFDTAAVASVNPHLIVPRNNFYVAQDYPPEIQQAIAATYNAPGFFENLEPLPHLQDAWQAMLDSGFHPRVASAPLSSSPTAIEGKIKWLDRVMVPEFGVSIVEEAIIDKDKWKYAGLALIDDRPDVPRGPNNENVAAWDHILFGWEHLSTVPLATAAFRLLSWGDTEHLISTLQMLETNRK